MNHEVTRDAHDDTGHIPVHPSKTTTPQLIVKLKYKSKDRSVQAVQATIYSKQINLAYGDQAFSWVVSFITRIDSTTSYQAEAVVPERVHFSPETVSHSLISST